MTNSVRNLVCQSAFQLGCSTDAANLGASCVQLVCEDCDSVVVKM
jgi:hypothetical protein